MKNKGRGANRTDNPIPEKLYFKIKEVSEITGVEPYILRYWESEFNIINPSRTKSKQRLYRRKDLELILEIKKLLYEKQFTIAGAKKKLKESNLSEEKNFQPTPPNGKYKTLLDDVKKELSIIKEFLSKSR
ncbi:MAG: MerR family transcriptional regulator [Deltaproteobacteria bacterium]|jgi:DNA-binding transcriptional MerR regulator|nr:MAG: MerR family transcriptional regulator [Deltaproteobacteria bacterium]